MEHPIALAVGATFGLGSKRTVDGRKERVFTAAGIEAIQAPLTGHHQLTVGWLRSTC